MTSVSARLAGVFDVLVSGCAGIFDVFFAKFTSCELRSDQPTARVSMKRDFL